MVNYSYPLLVGLLLFGSVCSQSAMAQVRDFTQCIADLQERARERGLPTWVVDEVLPGLEQQQRVIELDRSQPEFRQTFAAYFDRRVTSLRVEQGRDLRGEYSDFLRELTARYGIPGQYLIAFWGMETNFGRYLGKMPTLDSLATLACDERRSEFFSDELLTALSLLDVASLSPADMRGSWAGAMGHTQFMPSAYRKYAVDGDNDGKVNLWNSERDALASGANFLANLGWKRGERWGREVILPNNFPYIQSGLKNKYPIGHWSQLGVKMSNGEPLPEVAMNGAILLPAGHGGPAFLVYDNFEVIMRWNRSEFYALSVGVLADRIAGAGRLVNPPPENEPPLSRNTIVSLQGKLNELGFKAGKEDGVIGEATRAALRAFQGSSGMIADGYPDQETLTRLEIKPDPST